MKNSAIVLLLIGMPVSADDYCVRPNSSDWELAAGMTGNYDVVGREPESERTYAARIEFKEGKNEFKLTRTIGAKTVGGAAWFERCSPDKFLILKVKYSTAPKPLEGTCFFRMDGDNYYLISCRTRFPDSEKAGLETMFQMSEP